MRLPQYSPECCDVDPCISPETICKMLPDIQKEFTKLFLRHNKVMTKREHLHKLAEPKPRFIEPKFEHSCPCRDVESRKVEIIRMEQPMHTRTDQLAYPQPCTLLQLKNHPTFKEFPTRRKVGINRLLHQSLHSLYSRLSNTQPPKKPEKCKKWTKEERAVHNSYAKFLARPKKVHKPPMQPCIERPEGGFRRFKKLSKPKKYTELALPEWHLTSELKWYEPTKRILKMSKPKFYEKYDAEKRQRDMIEKALTYTATQRVKNLAQPRRFYTKDVIMTDAFKVSRNALKGKATDRILKLAQAKDYDDIHTRSRPYAVSRNALKAKMTPRLLELSKPRQYV